MKQLSVYQWFCAILLFLPIAEHSCAGEINGEIKFKKAAPLKTADAYAKGNKNKIDGKQEVEPVVWLEGAKKPKKEKKDNEEKNPQIIQKDQKFSPTVLIVSVNTTVDFPNLDDKFHNVLSYSSTKKFDLGRYPQGQTKSVTFDKAGLVKIYCEIHKSMKAVVRVVDSDFHSSLDKDGKFSLTNVPAGEYVIKIWKEGTGIFSAKVTVPKEGNVEFKRTLNEGGPKGKKRRPKKRPKKSKPQTMKDSVKVNVACCPLPKPTGDAINLGKGIIVKIDSSPEKIIPLNN